ncbi:hypothetical protein ACQPZF_16710 [Actinosynnema sp. CS-041913]
MTYDVRTCWGGQADAFDQEPDHGLRDPLLWGREIDDERYLLLSRR